MARAHESKRASRASSWKSMGEKHLFLRVIVEKIGMHVALVIGTRVRYSAM